MRYTEDKLTTRIFAFLLLLLAGWALLSARKAYPQDPGPTPDPSAYESVQEEYADWWSWSLRHPNVIVRKSRVAEARGRGVSGREKEEKLKVTGALPGRPPFASMIRSIDYEPFIRDGWLVGLWAQTNWVYETSSSTDIGLGPPEVDVYEEVPE